MEFYCVGGAVRDRLLGQAVNEKDYVVVGGTAEQLRAQGFKQVGKDFPVFLHPKTHEEYALARTERKKGPGYTGFSVHADPAVTLEEDLKRRDLTINAIAQTPEGQIIDPYGGIRDIQQKILRHVSPAFVEDPVRILRVARFMARYSSLGFKIAPETMALMHTMVQSGEVDALVPERIWREFHKALLAPMPGAFVTTLVQCGAWMRICPEWKIVSLEDQDTALSTLNQATQLTLDSVIRFVSLMKFIAPTEAQTIAIQQLAKRWRLPSMYCDLLLLSARYTDQVHQLDDRCAISLLTLLEKLDALRRKERFQRFLVVCEADWNSRSSAVNSHYHQKEKLLFAAQIIEEVSVKPLIAKGLKGIAFSQQLRALRLEALQCSSLMR